jgi:hypothetical protein
MGDAERGITRGEIINGEVEDEFEEFNPPVGPVPNEFENWSPEEEGGVGVEEYKFKISWCRLIEAGVEVGVVKGEDDEDDNGEEEAKADDGIVPFAVK